MKTLAARPVDARRTGDVVKEVAVLVDGSVGGETARRVAWALDAVGPIRVAVLCAAPSSVPRGAGHAEERLPFSADRGAVRRWLDRLAERAGTPSYGLAIQSAVDELAWTAGDDAVRTLVVVGAAPFDEGPIDPEGALSLARAEGVEVVLVPCGDPGAWPAASWRRAAEAAGVPAVAPERLGAVLANRGEQARGPRRSPAPGRSPGR